jgi:hypothetical protein
MRLDPEYKERERLKTLERYHANKEKYRAVQLAWLERNKELINEKRRQWRRDNPDLARERDKWNRSTTISYALARVRDGSMGLDELNQRLNKALVRIDDRTKSKGSWGSDDSV